MDELVPHTVPMTDAMVETLAEIGLRVTTAGLHTLDDDLPTEAGYVHIGSDSAVTIEGIEFSANETADLIAIGVDEVYPILVAHAG